MVGKVAAEFIYHVVFARILNILLITIGRGTVAG